MKILKIYPTKDEEIRLNQLEKLQEETREAERRFKNKPYIILPSKINK